MASNPNRKTRIPETREALHGGSTLKSTPRHDIIDEEPEPTAQEQGPVAGPTPKTLPATITNTSQNNSTRVSDDRPKHTRFPVKVSSSNPDVENIWQKYHYFWESDQAGLAIIAHDNSLAHNIVAVKRVKQQARNSQLDQLRQVTHDNLVKVLDVFTCVSLTYIVYESLETSLEKVQATCRGELTEIEMAIISKEILEGLKYIHNELGITHGNVISPNILLSYSSCRIKLANMAYSILSAKQDPKYNDVRALGVLLVSLKEPGTGGRNPGTLQLEKPHEVSNTCNDFLEKSGKSSAESLLEHDFLFKSPGVGRMRIFIYRAMECARRNPIKKTY
ncbi:kinase-like domain-containing protein [Aspergillus undulatus]|uniref:kinase-like domain-containing protein n=1 Tax=Aspergillus undulatus TaxID=1810928 RepID=UPI003CCE3BB0